MPPKGITRYSCLTRCLAALVITVPICSSLVAKEPAGVPATVGKFQAVLEQAWLQAPTSKRAISPGKFAGYSEPYFYLSNGRHLTFKMSGKSQRSELRQAHEWKTSTETDQRMIGSIRLALPSDREMEQFTFMQIHDSSKKLNKPLLRLAWVKYRKGTQDHLWSIVRDGTRTKSSYTYTDLGNRPDEFFGAEVTVKDNQLRIHINGEVKVDTDVSYWEQWSSYFKAGVYNQTEGSATVQFNSLRFES